MVSMSLTSQLRDKSSAASRFFAERFPDTRSAQRNLVARAANSKPLLPEVSGPYQWNTVGKAIDYRIRLAFPQAMAYADRWDFIAPEEFALVTGPELPPPLPAEHAASNLRLYEWAATFFASLRDTLLAAADQSPPSPDMEQELARHCYVLGLYDDAYRMGLRGPSPLYDVPASAGVAAIPRLCPDGTVADIVAMSHLFRETHADLLAPSREVVLGRGLAGSGDVGGADFDLLVDGCLIDVKATKDVGSLGGIPWAWQLLGYVLLDYEDALAVRSLGLYLARQGLLVEWPLDDFCEMLGASKPSPLADLRKDFRKAVKSGRSAPSSLGAAGTLPSD